MNEMTFDRKGTFKFLAWSFLIAWLMQIVVFVLYKNGHAVPGQLLMAVMMLVPLLSVIFSGHGLKGMGWKPHIRRNVKVILIAWFVPAFLTALGAVAYFMIFPEHFDISGRYLVENAGADVLEQLEEQGLTYPLYVVITVVGCLTYAPFFNMFAAVGEEAGWRGFLYPQLKLKFGSRKGWLLGGCIWGIWHWPLIWLIRYEYGTDYVGFPVVGMLIFCIITISIGIISDWLYVKSGCIWIPSIFHGSINAAATVPLAVCLTNTESMRLLGPAPNGLLAGLPLVLLAVILFFKATQ